MIFFACRCRWRYRRTLRLRHRWHACSLYLGHMERCRCECGDVCPSLFRGGTCGRRWW